MTTSRKILLIEDEPGLRLTLTDRLRKEGYEVEAVADGDSGYEKASTGDFDAMLLDIMLPGKNGFDICRDLRQQGIATPILMLTARGETVEKVLGLKIGADDYLTKPFETMELLARIEALLRRAERPSVDSASSVRFGTVRVDFRRAEATKDGKLLNLSAKEFRLLRYFLSHRGQTLSRQQLLQEVWSYNIAASSRTVDVHVAWLRQKLEDDPKNPRWILTVHGLGYKFAD
jgi:two-component system alkaline phosphatase synthesis response regulator PhoP